MYSTRRMLERGRREANTLVRVAVLLKFAECRLGSGCQAKDPGWHRGSAAIPCAAGIPAPPCPLHSRRRRYGLGNGGVTADRTSAVWGQSVSVRLDLGVLRIFKPKKYLYVHHDYY